MWVDYNFMNELEKAMRTLSSGKIVDVDASFKAFKSEKYRNIIDSINKNNNRLKSDRANLKTLLKDLVMMNEATLNGSLDTNINVANYDNEEYKIVVNGINSTMHATVLALREIGNNLDRLSNGNFQAQITKNYEGDYKVLQHATNSLGKLLNKLIVDSNKMMDATENGRLDERIDLTQYSGNFQDIAASINLTMEKNEHIQWLQKGVALLNSEVLGVSDIAEISSKAINFLCNYLNAGVGSLYSFDENEATLSRIASYAYVHREESLSVFKLGEGTVGQVALQRTPIQLKNIQRTDLVIDTGVISEPPLNTYTFALIYQNELFGVIEIGSSELFDKRALELFESANSIIATALATAHQNQNIKELLVQAETLNAELEEQQQQLEEANAQMEEQQQELEEANSQMEEQQQELSSSAMTLKEKNEGLKKSQLELDKRARDLEISNKYKSEFLANMSHELRTPLNSIILLSDMLQENKAQRLDIEEVKKASIIHDSGNELLRLINDILDLSKIEAGKMALIVDEFDSAQLCEEFHSQFEHAAQQKNLTFVTVDRYKNIIVNDKDRLAQILRNLISNSLKFTKEGSITLQIEATKDKKVKLSVIDTGIGVPKQKAQSIFEAFQQADGGTSREYGGTGLGLSISKELVKMMGGKITLESESGKGSIFSIIIPNLSKTLNVQTPTEKSKTKVNIKEIEQKPQEDKTIADDREIITAMDNPFLIIEDDAEFAAILREKINEKNEYALIALNGKDGLHLAFEYDNLKGVMLDLGLPDMDGIDVLKEFKTNTALRKTPIYIISGEDREKITKEHGALGYAQKPVSNIEITTIVDKINNFNDKTVKDLLIVEDNENQRNALKEFIGKDSIKSQGVGNVKDAIKELSKGIYDCIIVDLGLEDGTGYDICEYIQKNKLQVPIIIYTGSDLTTKEEKNLRKYTDSIIIKTASSQTRLLDEIDIFMHRVKVKTGTSHENVINIDLSGHKILVVDDDIRNIYVLSEALNSKGANVITANNGEEAIDILHQNLDTNMILMDIMMPVMNGYEATKIIKKDDGTKHIPIIAVTAKAMREDKENALKAGCDDYISKPLKMDTLVGIIKGWLNKA